MNPLMTKSDAGTRFCAGAGRWSYFKDGKCYVHVEGAEACFSE